VVKNVTGYDLPKLLAGSFGTLAVMDEVTVKVLPRPEKTRTILLYGLDATAANAAMTKALTGPYDISAAAFLPEIQAQASDCDYVGAQGSVTALRVEGSGPVVEHHCAALRRDFGGASEELHSANSIVLWREIRDLAPFFDIDTILWRISVPPAHGAGVAASCAIDIPGSNFLLDWGGGLIWLSIPANGGAQADKVRRAFARCGGHATLMRAPEPERRKVQVFEAEGANALTEAVKNAFDPERMLNPGRMFEGV
jgi:glycolate oxidase FAD binding subunit